MVDGISIPDIQLRTGIASLTDPQIFQNILFELKKTNQALNRVSPDDLAWATFPGTGEPEPMPSGKSVVDFRRGGIKTPAGDLSFSVPQGILQRTQSLIIISDTYLQVTITPGFGTFFTPWDLLEIPARNIEQVTLDADVPYNMALIAGTGMHAALISSHSFQQYRISNLTITKTLATTISDPWIDVPFTSATPLKTLDQDRFGKPYLRYPGGSVRKTFVLRNLGVANAEVQLYGSLSLGVASLTRWVVDPDTAGTPPSVIPVDTGSNVILETGIDWVVVEMRVRVISSAIQGDSTKLSIEHVASVPGIR